MTKQSSIWLVVIVIIVAVGIVLLITQQKPKEKEIKIGSIGILTGNIADAGITVKNGIDMAIDEINSRGGVNGKKLKAVHEDSEADVKKTISAFQKLTTIDNINIIIGTTWSNTGLAIVELAKEKETLLISPSLGAAEFNEASKFIFNTRPHDFILSGKLADYVYDKGHRKVAIISTQQIWVKEQTNVFKKRFEELGGSITVLIEPGPEDRNVSTEALKVKEKQDEIDAIISTTDGMIVGVLVAKKVKELGVELPIYSVILTADIITASDGAYEGLEFLTFFDPASEFQSEYKDRYGTEVDIGGDSAYDAVMLIAEAMKVTESTDTTVLQEYLNKVKIYEGASGTLISDGKGGFTKDHVVIKKVINGIAVDMDR